MILNSCAWQTRLCRAHRCRVLPFSASLSVSVRNQLNRVAPAERQCIAGVAEACGDETAVLAAFLDRYFGDENMAKLNAAIGAGATGAFERLNNFEKAVVTYQNH